MKKKDNPSLKTLPEIKQKASAHEAVLEKEEMPITKNALADKHEKIKPFGKLKKPGPLSFLQKREIKFEAQSEAKEKEIDRELRKIYQDGQDEMPNMTKLEFKNKNRTRNLAIGTIAVLFLIFIVSFLGFLFFQPKPKFTSEKVNLEIKAPFSINSGENVNYQIKFTNAEDISLTKVQLIVYLPAGFIYSNSNQPPQIKDEQAAYSNIKTWQIKDLYPTQSQTIEINGKLIATLESKQPISAILSYVPANFNSEFQKTAKFNTDVNDSLVTLEVEHDSQIANEEETEFTLKLSNKSTQLELNNLIVELNYPPEFSPGESQIIDPDNQTAPEIIKPVKDETSPKIWSINSLLPQAKKIIKLKGKFTVSESAKPEITAQVKLKGPSHGTSRDAGQGGPTEEAFIQREEKFTIEVIKGELLNNLIINGSNQNQAVNFSDTLNYLVNIQNKSKKTLGDIKVRMVVDSTFLDWASLKDDYQGVREESQILWTKEQIPKLALLLPEEEVEINFQIKLQNTPSKKYKTDDYKVASFFEAQINKIDNTDAQIVTNSPAIINEINTDLDLKNEGRYFDDQSNTIGSGPLPPIVGQKTTYKIFWTLTNSLHEINNIEVKTKLPDYVTFEDQNKISTGNLYKNQQNEIIWQISRIPASVNQATAEFEISITPESKDAQKILTLMPEILLKAFDSQTKGQISKSFSGLTTNLDTDPLGKGKGLVQEE